MAGDAEVHVAYNGLVGRATGTVYEPSAGPHSLNIVLPAHLTSAPRMAGLVYLQDANGYPVPAPSPGGTDIRLVGGGLVGVPQMVALHAVHQPSTHICLIEFICILPSRACKFFVKSMVWEDAIHCPRRATPVLIYNGIHQQVCLLLKADPCPVTLGFTHLLTTAFCSLLFYVTILDISRRNSAVSDLPMVDS